MRPRCLAKLVSARPKQKSRSQRQAEMKKCVGSRKPEKVAEEIGKTMPMEKKRPSANTVAAVQW